MESSNLECELFLARLDNIKKTIFLRSSYKTQFKINLIESKLNLSLYWIGELVKYDNSNFRYIKLRPFLNYDWKNIESKM